MKPTALDRRRVLAASCALVAAPALVALPARAADAVKLKFSSFEPPMANITSNVLAPLARDIAAASGGTVQIDMYAGGTLGRNPTQQLKLVTDGVADLAWVVLPYTPGRFDDTEVAGLPFVTRDATEASLALQRIHAAGALVGFQGLKMLALAATPPVVIHANQPVRLPRDLKGKRVRLSGDHLTRVVEALGGAPVQVGGAQIAEAMSRGVVDMTFNNWGFVGDFKVNEVSSQHLDLPLGAVAVGVVMRQDRYDALPPQGRAAIDKASGEALARRLGEAFDRQEKEVRERVSRSGRNTVTAPSAEEVAEWKRLIEPVNQSWRQAKPRNERTYAAFTEQLKRIRAGA
jgi:TRAP-type C4-dicarboxylate transport system substrate-binding protein